MGRLLDEDMVINALQTTKFRNDLFVDRGYARAISIIKELPTIQPEPSILLSWVEKYIEWLKSFDNEFANLEAAHISVMVKKWRDEQHETD